MRNLQNQPGFKSRGSSSDSSATRRNKFSQVSFLLMIVALCIASLLLFAACGGAATKTVDGTTPAGETATDTTAKTFTVDELAKFDGQNGNKAYIAVDGTVYDVTALAEWGSNLHAGNFVAGKDYSAEIKNAPHPVSNLLKAVKVGVLAN